MKRLCSKQLVLKGSRININTGWIEEENIFPARERSALPCHQNLPIQPRSFSLELVCE